MTLSRIHITRFSLLITGAIAAGMVTSYAQFPGFFQLLDTGYQFGVSIPLLTFGGAGLIGLAQYKKTVTVSLFFGSAITFLALAILFETGVLKIIPNSLDLATGLFSIVVMIPAGLITGSLVRQSCEATGAGGDSDAGIYVWSLFLVVVGAGLSILATTAVAAWNGYSAQLFLLVILSAAGGLLHLIPSKASKVVVSKQPDATFQLSRNRREVSVIVVILSAMTVLQCTLPYFTAIFGNSVYTPTTVMSVWVLLLGGGMASWQRWLSWRWTSGTDGYRILIIVTAFASVGWVFLLSRLPLIQDHTAILAGDGRFRTVILCFLIAVLALALPSFCHGALFARLLSIQLPSKNVSDSGMEENRKRRQKFFFLLYCGFLSGPMFFPILERMIGISWIIAAIPQMILVLAPRTTRTWFVAALAVTGFSAIFLISHRMPVTEIHQTKAVTANQSAASVIWGRGDVIDVISMTVCDPAGMPDELRRRWDIPLATFLSPYLGHISSGGLVLDLWDINNWKLSGNINLETLGQSKKAIGREGWFVLWFPVNELDAGSFRLLISTFNKTFDQSHMILQDDGEGSFVAGLFGAGPEALCSAISGLKTLHGPLADRTGMPAFRLSIEDILGGYLGDKEWMNSRFGISDSDAVDTIAKRKLAYRIPVQGGMKTSEFISWVVTDWESHLNESIPPFHKNAAGETIADPDTGFGAVLKIRRKAWFLYLEGLSLRNRGEVIPSLERFYLAAVLDPTFEPLYRYLIPPARSVHEDSDPIVKKIYAYLTRLNRL